MPNWCSNKLVIIGTRKEIGIFVQSLGDGRLTFEKLLPMPEELKGIHKGSILIDGKQYEHWREEVIDGTTINVPIPEHKIAELKAKFGACDWYDWNIENWGTKWDIEPQELVEGDHKTIAPGANLLTRGDELGFYYGDALVEVGCNFDTAWSPPTNLIDSLSKKYPGLAFGLFFAEGGMGFWGAYAVKDGVSKEIKGEGFWKTNLTDDDYENEPIENCIPVVQEFLSRYGLHTGG